MDDEPVEVVQKLNLVKLLQASLERIHSCRTKDTLSIELVRLYTLLAPLRAIDASFEAEWNTVLGGKFVHFVATTVDPHKHSWTVNLRAQEVLMNLMERHGMGFQANLPDPVLKQMAEVEAQLDAYVAQATDNPEPAAVSVGDDEGDEEGVGEDD